VVGVDVNLSYLAVARQRFMRLGPTLQLHCADAEKVELEPGGLDLIHAALLLEFVDPRVALPRAASWLAPGGALSLVMQLPGGPPLVSATADPALRAVAERMRLMTPEEVRRITAEAGLVERRAFVVPLPSGRRLFAALYARGG
jgi:ubiquinone/menaquinone biosynthesis C-methylase UbiE